MENIDPFWLWTLAVCLVLLWSDNKLLIIVVVGAIAFAYSTAEGARLMCRMPVKPADFSCPYSPPKVNVLSAADTLGYVAQELKKAG